MLVVIYSYGGTEIIGVTLAETKNPEKAVPKAVRSTLTRIIAFYLFPFFIIVSLIPWNEVNGVSQSPFVMVFKMIGIPGADHIMNAVILLAVISSMNSGLIRFITYSVYTSCRRSGAEDICKFSVKQSSCLCNLNVYIISLCGRVDFLICRK